MGLGVLPEAIGPFRSLVVLLEIGVQAWRFGTPVVVPQAAFGSLALLGCERSRSWSH